MTDLTNNSPRKFEGENIENMTFPMGANLQLFAGSALMMAAATGLAANCTPTASGIFIGFADEEKDNRTGSAFGGLAASCNIAIRARGRVWLTVAEAGNWARTQIGATVYASDGNVFTTAAGTNNILIGKVAAIPTAAVGAASASILVAFEAEAFQSL